MSNYSQKITSIYNTESEFKCILGPPGSGKSRAIEQFLEWNSNYGIKCSSTGISALNIGGRTIHSTLGYYDTKSLQNKIINGDIFKNLRAIKNRFDNIIIDEVSALPGPQIDLICWSIKEFNEGKSEEDKLGLLIVGDVGQLLPVKESCFINSQYWESFKTVHLKEIFRQNNPEFIKALMQIRLGKAEKALDYFDSTVGFNNKLKTNFKGLTFVSTNSNLNSFNNYVLKKISSTPQFYKAFTTGKEKKEWSEIAKGIELKVGVQVMITVNNNREGYVNGDIAVVTELMRTGVWVYIERLDRTYFINYISQANINVKNKQIGMIKYLPLKMAYATTVNKCQGLTLNKSQVYLKENFLGKLSGGLSVALSRVRKPEGLRLVGTQKEFIKACYLDEHLQKIVEMSTAEEYIN